MSGPIIRTGTNPKFWEGWDKAFGNRGKHSTEGKKSAASKAAAERSTEKIAKKKAAKKAAKKTTKKA